MPKIQDIKDVRLKSDLQNGQDYNKLELYIDGVNFPLSAIISLVIREYVFSTIPTLELTLIDDYALSEMNPLQEGQEIKVNMAINKNADDIVENVFEIVSFNYSAKPVSQHANRANVVISAAFKANALIGNLGNKSYPSTTSSGVVKDIAGDLGIKFEILKDTKDKMNWYRLDQTYNEFMSVLNNKGSAGDNDCPFIYINRNGKLIYNTLRTALDNDIKKNFTQDSKSAQLAALGSDENFFSSYNLIDASGFANKIMGGNAVVYSYYDMDNTVYKQIGEIETTELGDFKNKTIDNINKPSKHFAFGTQNISLFDGYYEAIARNYYLRNTILSTSIIINAQPDGDINLFDVINIKILSSKDRNQEAEPFSGRYLVTGIVHAVTPNARSSMWLVLSRDGQNKTLDYKRFESKLKES
tara:strand:- start:12906 stop:14147 length:1242 start_codon:yes stop_codon:yes gene_type:complete